MTETLVFKTVDSTLALTAEEKKLFLDLLSAQDRGGFYMVYNAMTDTAESSLQSRISTFSGGVGGAGYGDSAFNYGLR
jgi:hypothetical protein